MRSTNDQAVLVYFDVLNLPKEINDIYDLEDQLIEVIESKSLGEFDGNEFGPDGAVLYMYGPSAEDLFSSIEPILHANPLCQNARVVIRQGGPGAQQREVILPKS